MKHQSLRTTKLLLLWLGALMVTLTLWGGQRVQADVVDSTGPTSMLSSSPDRVTTAGSTKTTVTTRTEVPQPPAAPAGREISDHVASLTVQGNKDTDGMYSQGAEVKIEGSFNDAKGPIRSGDHIDLTWPTDNEVTPYLVAFSGQTALTHHGVHIGDFTVTETGGQLTFNDNVEQFMSGVQGTFFFNAKLYTRSQQDGMAKLVVGPYVEFLAVKGVPQSSDNPGALTHDQTWYGNKNGRAVPWNGKNWVDWDVRLNEYRAYLAAPIKLHDVIPAGLRLDPERLTFWIDNDEPINLAAFQARYPHSSIQLNGNTITAVFSQDEFSGRRITFRYKTEIQDLNALNFTNSLAGAYQLQGQEVQNFTYQKTVQNISFGADITGTLPGELKIFKYYPTDKGPQALAGVTFRIKNVATRETFEATTEQNGIITRQRMLPGKYEVREISAPDWIDFSKVQGQVWTVEVLEDQPGQTLMIKNEKKRTSIPWTDYSNNPAKTVIPWTDYSNSPAKTVIPWTDYSNNPAKTVIPWTDYSNNVAKTVKPALPAEQPTKWLPLAPATVITMNQPNSTPHATSITITDQTPVRDTNQAQLPQTGTASESILLEIGLALLSICFGVSRTRWKQS